MKDRAGERGVVILWLFIAVALFGALLYTFTRSTRTSTTWLEKESAKAGVTGDKDCDNALALATKRLELRGCGALISYEPDGSNPHDDGPTDGSCSVYHPNGGGVANCKGLAIAQPLPTDPCHAANNPVAGQLCDDGTYYIRTTGGFHIFMAGADEPGTYRFKTTNTSTAGNSDPSSGYDATDLLISAGAGLHPAAEACRLKGPDWFLPQFAEYQPVQTTTNNPPLGNLGVNRQYWAARNTMAAQGFYWRKGVAPTYFIQSGVLPKITATVYVRCFRRIPE